jgi:hypothetical protein
MAVISLHRLLQNAMAQCHIQWLYLAVHGCKTYYLNLNSYLHRSSVKRSTLPYVLVKNGASISDKPCQSWLCGACAVRSMRPDRHDTRRALKCHHGLREPDTSVRPTAAAGNGTPSEAGATEVVVQWRILGRASRHSPVLTELIRYSYGRRQCWHRLTVS